MTDQKAAAIDRALARTHYAGLSALNGYPEIFSVFKGESVHIRLACKPSLNPLALFRTVTVEAIELINVVTGAAVAAPVAPGIEIGRQKPKSYRDEGACYTTRIAIATDGLEPGLYECVIRASSGAVSTRIHFNVKPKRHRDYDLVCVLPTFTWQAYNRIAGGSFYSDGLGLVRTITTQRPVSLRGDNSIEAAIPFLAAFAEAGARVACVDSMDLHRGLLPGGPAPVMALLTHDEYWSEPMRRAIDAYVKRGGVLMVIAGNVCWWKIEVDGDNLTVDKTPPVTQRGIPQVKGHQWHQQGEPEERTFVSSFRFGGYAAERIPKKTELDRFKGLRGQHDQGLFKNPGSIKIERPDHPLFEGVTPDPGGRLGEEVPLVYREIDAVPLKADGSVDRMWYDADKIEPEILATGMVIRGAPFHVPVAQAGIVVEADVGRGHVLHMGTFGWSLGLGKGDERVKRVILNAHRYCREIARERRGR